MLKIDVQKYKTIIKDTEVARARTFKETCDSFDFSDIYIVMDQAFMAAAHQEKDYILVPEEFFDSVNVELLTKYSSFLEEELKKQNVLIDTSFHPGHIRLSLM